MGSVSGEDPKVEAEAVEVVGEADVEGPVAGQRFAGGAVEVDPEAAVSCVVRERDGRAVHCVEGDGEGLGRWDADLGGCGECGGPLVISGV